MAKRGMSYKTIGSLALWLLLFASLTLRAAVARAVQKEIPNKAVCAWPSSGAHDVVVTAANGYHAVAAVWTSDVEPCDNCVYLPLVLSGYAAPRWLYENSGCLRGADTTEERVEVYVEDGEIVVDHHNAIYNCCATIDVSLIDARPLFQVVECERFAYEPCRCVCPYHIRARISDLPPAKYRVEVLNCSRTRVYGWGEVTVP